MQSTNEKEIQRFTPQFLLMRLRHATTAQDDLSETVASTFMRSTSSETTTTPVNSKEVDDFVKEFPFNSSSESKDVLRSLFLSLSPPFSYNRARDTIKYLQELEDYNNSKEGYTLCNADTEEQALKDAVLGRLVAGIYAEALDILLAEAFAAEVEAEWWADLERSRVRVVYYLIQTLPLRVSNLFGDVLHILHSNNRPLSFSAFKPSSIRSLLKKEGGHSNSIIARMFPHLRTYPRLVPPPLAPSGVYSLSFRSSSAPPSNIIVSTFRTLWHTFSLVVHHITHYVTLPLRLASQEIHTKRLALERIRDERAEALGELSSKRDDLSRTLREDLDECATFLQIINQVLVGQKAETAQIGLPTSLMHELVTTSSKVFPMHISLHQQAFRNYSLLRPSKLVRIWPRLLFLPPFTLYVIQRVGASQDTLLSLVSDAWETLKGFWRGWLLEPLTDIVKTVRTGGEGSIIVQQGSIDADLQSLERMALPVQLDELSTKLRFGDFTPILQIYEEDIKSPVRSAISGSLLRSAFVQIQKAKVDVDQALAGIDKLLKSQELTFAFVGVAPALSLVYVAGGYWGRLYTGASSKGHLGGRKRRTAAWLAMRPPYPGKHVEGAIPRLTAGLLLLSVSSLRQYGETWLPPRSRLREGFLEDVGDLEDPGLNRKEKMRVVERMWRSWGHALGWERLAAEVSS
ncbi:ATP synthase regulation protein NCA2-domain-containing protein [Multifurca ochricompacta]|uniref:ATP synthase regulation protein NCA2-domain-containing protein n=1 Tax=Multifurca ochricompacta TaxID=376703 RepID=A0AAD4QNR4_9AGAM|nr:ATP synthase regulation protein NCA2-domain-containing protein [Multifurca ochricompacta]